ncbi:HAD-IC family P-type ATPase [Nesterenkonia halotolerans]|uniref:Cation-transporting ATPase E n=1 Tax=Nesterenkonia halotolerans TaxID=225325 RepID=A0ABR9J6S9_9MICC|nr:HAD-IC family P-type ATPase [Nesterenkonia halotolerans]MBE1514689.1 cation-transporting ATPase E [Nesterenkonia halotolerans]
MAAQRTEIRDPAETRSAVDPATLESEGLNSVQVLERHRLGLANVQPRTTSRSLTEILRTHLMTLFNLIIGICALAIIVLGRWLDLLFAVAAVANVIIGLFQEYSAKRKLDAIALLHQDSVRALRDGMLLEIHREQIVLDDVIELHRGDEVPADGTVLSSAGLDVDESMLTGESDAVPKRRDEQLLSGTAVVAGSGRFRVTAVGERAHAVKLATEAKRYQKINSELRRALEKIAFWLSLVLLPIVAVVLNGQMQAFGGWNAAWASGQWRDAVVTAVSSVTAMIPQGLALMTTIAFAVAAVKLSKQNVLIQEQPAVEILARVDVVCLDKTGTLTDGTIAFHQATPLTPLGHPEVVDRGPDSTALEGTDGWEQALAFFGADEHANATAAALRAPYRALPRHRAASQVQFSSARRWSAVTFAEDSGALAGHWVLGAPEMLRQDAVASGVEVDALLRRTDALSSRGLRTMLLAHAPLDGPIVPGGTGPLGRGERLPQDLSPVALLTFKENVRPEARATLEYFREQNVALKVISGDSPKTAAAVAREVGMAVEGDAVDASTLPSDPAALREVLEHHSVFGRVSPEQKRLMVETLKSAGHVVAMTGDGVNDALAMKKADLGIAMGDGAPATKAVSRMVLLDGRFDRLPSVLAEGRKVIANTERVAHLFLSKTAYAILLGLVYGLLFWEFPFLPRQFSTVDFLMLGCPAFFLALMPNTRLYRPGFLRRSVVFAIPTALAIVLSVVTVSAFGRYLAEPAAAIQTAATLCLTAVGLWVLNVALRPLTPLRVTLISCMYLLLAAVLLVPVSQQYHLFAMPSTELLSASVVSIIIGCGLVDVGSRATTALARRRGDSGNSRAQVDAE